MKNFFIGLIMGACDIVPGVSGGTIAFISGIYERFLTSIRSCLDMSTFKLLLRGKIVEAWNKVDGLFLLSVFGGIFTSIILFSRVLEGLLHSHPHLVRGFFLGLIITSIIILIQEQQVWGAREIVGLIVGGVIAFMITKISPTEVIPHRRIILGSAMIAISAMILPGISGSFLLLIMGMYGHVIGAISSWDLAFLALFGVGIILGLTVFTRVVGWALQTYHSLTIAILIGFMIGAIPKLRPRQNPTKTMVDRHGEEVVLQSELIFPGEYIGDHQTLFVILLFLVGSIGSWLLINSLTKKVAT